MYRLGEDESNIFEANAWNYVVGQHAAAYEQL